MLLAKTKLTFPAKIVMYADDGIIYSDEAFTEADVSE